MVSAAPSLLSASCRRSPAPTSRTSEFDKSHQRRPCCRMKKTTRTSILVHLPCHAAVEQLREPAIMSDTVVEPATTSGTTAGRKEGADYCKRHCCSWERRGGAGLQAARGRRKLAARGNGCGCGALFVAAMWREKLRKRACGFDMVPGVVSFSDKI